MKLLFLILLTIKFCVATSNDTERIERSSQNVTLYLLSVLPYPGTPGVHDTLSSVGPTFTLAAEIALESINNRSDILGGYNLALIRGVSGCSVTTVNITLRTLISQLFYNHDERVPTGNVVGIVGPTCSDAALAISYQIARPEISLLEITTASSQRLSQRESFPNTFSTSGSSDIFVDALLALMRINSWNIVATIYDASHNVFSTLFRNFRDRVKADSNFAMTSMGVFDEASVVDLEALNLRNIRIIFLITGPGFGRKILCLAANYERLSIMYSQYQFVLLTDTVENFIKADVTFRHDQKTVSCGVEKMKAVVEGAIILRHQYMPLDVNIKTDVGMSYSEFLQRYYASAEKENITFINNATPIYFDAVWSLALALNKSIANLSGYSYGQPSITESVREELEELNFTGVSGRMHFDRSTGFTDRNLDIFQVINSTMILLEYFDSENDQIEQHHNGSVHYIKGTFDTYTYALLPIGVILMIVTLIVAAILVCLQVLSITHTKYHSIKAASPKITHTAYVGCYVIALGIIVYIVGESLRVSGENKCHYLHTYNCLLILGQVFLYATLVVRTFRIYRIFVRYLDPGRFIGNYYLVAFVIVAVCVVIPPLIIWGLNVLPEAQHIPLLENDVVKVWVQCLYTNNYRVWQGLLFSYSWMFAIAACVFGLLSVDKVKLKDFQISSIICLCVMLLLEIPLLIIFLFAMGTSPYNQDVPRTDIDLIFAARCLVPILALYLCLLLFFLPPFFPLFKEKGQAYFNQRTSSIVYLRS